MIQAPERNYAALLVQKGPCRFCGKKPCFVHCVYCLVDCTDHPNVEHGPACPSVTGAFPNEDSDSPCCRCGKAIGEWRYYAEIAEDVAEAVCASCKFDAEMDAA